MFVPWFGFWLWVWCARVWLWLALVRLWLSFGLVGLACVGFGFWWRGCFGMVLLTVDSNTMLGWLLV